MRKIEREMLKALTADKYRTLGNTKVAPGGKVYLHGNQIADMGTNRKEGYITISSCGWETPTTRSRLNVLLREYAAGHIYSKRGKWRVSFAGFEVEFYCNMKIPTYYLPRVEEANKIKQYDSSIRFIKKIFRAIRKKERWPNMESLAVRGIMDLCVELDSNIRKPDPLIASLSLAKPYIIKTIVRDWDKINFPGKEVFKYLKSVELLHEKVILVNSINAIVDYLNACENPKIKREIHAIKYMQAFTDLAS